ncbi:MAG: DNA translocase FtsK [Chloroflexi bacterium]|nr:DNA translocase FtsK [Chloroflexota bacterium]
MTPEERSDTQPPLPFLNEPPDDAVVSPEALEPESQARWHRWVGNGLGLGLFTWALLTAIGLVQYSAATPSSGAGWLLRLWVVALRKALGLGSFAVVMLLAWAGLGLLLWAAGQHPRIHWDRVLAWELALASWLAWLGLRGGLDLERVAQGYDGGVIGWGLARLVTAVMPREVGLVVLPFFIAVFAAWGMGWLPAWLARGREWARALSATPRAPTPTASAQPTDVAPAPEASSSHTGSKQTSSATSTASRRETVPQVRKTRLRIQYAPASASSKRARGRAARKRGKDLPPLTLLKPEARGRTDQAQIQRMAAILEKTLAEFDIPARVVGVQVGPTVVQFALEPGYIEKPGPDGEMQRQKVRVAQIVRLQRDLALALAAERLRIQAPVPGRPYIGIEVRNPKARLVRLRPLLESEAFARVNSPLALALGRQVSGEPLVADLAAMPHLLIAGATGSGKSVFLRSMVINLVMNNTPDRLRLILLDPKRVELSRFAGLPHILGQVETDPERILVALQWAVAEMQRRYTLFEKARVRDLAGYNRKAEEPLPYIVIMVDELADLMMQAPESTETALIRLAQLARATGIHLMIATQRPSTDVITGLIKANFPARLAFAVASSVDSRVILDTPGAEHLLGRGDMLFRPPDAPAPIRAQGVWVDEEEIQRVMTWWQQHASAEGEPRAAAAPWEALLRAKEEGPRWDPLLEQAARLVIETGRAHTTLLQRRLRIGYPRAARLMEQLEEVGVVGPPKNGSRERDVLWDPEVPFQVPK